MHEFTLASSIRDIALECAREHSARRITAVRCRVGALRQACPDLLRIAFEACCDGTPAENAMLILEHDPVRVTCHECSQVTASERMIWQCPACGQYDLTFEGGTDLSVTSLEIEQENDDGDQSAAQRSGTQRFDRRGRAPAAR